MDQPTLGRISTSPRSPVAPMFRRVQRTAGRSGFVSARAMLLDRMEATDPDKGEGVAVTKANAPLQSRNEALHLPSQQPTAAAKVASALRARLGTPVDLALQLDLQRSRAMASLDVVTSVADPCYGLPIFKSSSFIMSRRAEGLAAPANAMRHCLGIYFQRTIRAMQTRVADWTYFDRDWRPCDGDTQSILPRVVNSVKSVPPFARLDRRGTPYFIACVPFFSVRQFVGIVDACPDDDGAVQVGTALYFIQINGTTGAKRPIRVRFPGGPPAELTEMLNVLKMMVLRVKNLDTAVLVGQDAVVPAASATSDDEAGIGAKLATTLADLRVGVQASIQILKRRFSSGSSSDLGRAAILTHASTSVGDSFLAMPRGGAPI